MPLANKKDEKPVLEEHTAPADSVLNEELIIEDARQIEPQRANLEAHKEASEEADKDKTNV